MTEVISYKLTGDWRHIVEDGLVDTDALPDEALPTGHVEFIPVSPQVAVSGSPDTAYTVSSFKALIAAGVLTDLQGRDGVQIAGKIGERPILWRAITHLEYRERKIDYPTVEFTLEADARLTGIIASEIPGEPATIYHPRIEALISELDSKSDVGHGHRITDVEGLQQALEDAANSGGDGTGGGGGGPVSWTLVTNKPTTFPPSAHTHPLGDVSGLQAALDAKVGTGDPRLSDARQPTAHTHSWASLTGKPSTFPPEGHGHSISDISGLQQALEDAANSGTGGGGDGSPVTWISILNKPSEFPPEAHTHLMRDVSGLQAALDAKVGDTDPRLTDARTPKSHTHYWSEVTGKPLSYPPSTHTHVIGDTTGLQGALDSKVGNSDPRLSDARTPTAHTHVWDEVTGKPSVFPPEVHGHSISQVTGLQGALDGKSATGHDHSINDVDGLQAALDAVSAGSGSSVKSVYFYAAPYTNMALIPNPVDGDVFVNENVIVYSYIEGSWQLSAGLSPVNIEDEQLTDGAISRVKLSQDLQGELDGLRTDVTSKVDTTDPRLSDARTPTAHTHSWASLTAKPTEFPPAAHDHVIADVTDLQTSLDAKAEATHSHGIADVTGLQAALDAAAASGGGSGGSGGSGNSVPPLHIEGYPYLTTSQIPNPVVGERFWRVSLGVLAIYDGTYWYNANIAPGLSTVSTSKIIDDAVTRAKLAPAVRTELDTLRTDLNAAGGGGGTGPVSWTSITDKPATFTPTAHTHSVADVSGLQGALDGKAATAHTHTIGNVTGLQTALDGKAATSHTHTVADVTGLQGALDGKANSAHTHTAADVGAVANLGGITGAVSITRAAYDALTTKNPTVLYAIREA